MINQWLHLFFHDKRVQTLIVLIVLDLILGVSVSVVKGKFRFSFISDFMRNDVLGKVLPFFVIYGGYLYSQHSQILIPGVDLKVVMDASWVFVMAALVGSLLNSLKDFGLPLPTAIAGDDPGTPSVPANPPTP